MDVTKRHQSEKSASQQTIIIPQPHLQNNARKDAIASPNMCSRTQQHQHTRKNRTTALSLFVISCNSTNALYDAVLVYITTDSPLHETPFSQEDRIRHLPLFCPYSGNYFRSHSCPERQQYSQAAPVYQGWIHFGQDNNFTTVPSATSVVPPAA
jgi:hypothetical protein